MRTLIGLALALTALLVVTDRASAADAARRPMNFIVIMADDLGAKELGCYGHAEHRTPNLDALAASGMQFRTCYATPICSSSRVLIMTGRYGLHTGWHNFMLRAYSPQRSSPQFDLGTSEITFAEVLKPLGYRTALAGKWQLSGDLPDRIHECGFDEYRIWAYKEYLPPGVEHTGAYEGKEKNRTARYWHPCVMENGKYVPTTADDYGPHLYSQFLIDFMTRHRDEPFCLYYPMALTHSPWDPTPSLDEPGKRTNGGLKNNVEAMDYVVGRIVNAVEQLGLRENTVILFTGDNGTGGDGKGTVTELGARVPMIVSCPGTVQSGVVSDELVDLSDVLPTLAEMAGAPLPSDRLIDGVSLAATLRGSAEEHRSWCFSYLGDKRVLRDKRWLLEGNGRFFDCGTSRDGSGYRDVTDSRDAEVLAARKRFDEILATLPAPTAEYPGLVQPTKQEEPKAKKRAGGQRKKQRAATS